MTADYRHSIEFQVRDYECDIQGVVNNGVYQNYLEHARHEFLQSRGINFAETAKAGINLVVIRAELAYKQSLVSGDRFVVRSCVRQTSRLKFQFEQDIYRTPDETLMLAARIIGTSVNSNGRPFVPEFLVNLFEDD